MNKLKYILTLIIGLLILTTNVKAEETTCNELLPNYPEGYEWRLDGSILYLYNCGTTNCNRIFYLEYGKSYTLFYNNADIEMSLYDYLPTSTSAYSLDTSNTYYSIITPKWNIGANLTLFSNSNTTPPDDLVIHLVEGTEPCGITTTEPEEPTEPETPIDPDYPDISETDQGVLLTNFYSIYIEKLSSISNFAMENKFVLSAITIILVLVCLDLFLYLFKGSGYR